MQAARGPMPARHSVKPVGNRVEGLFPADPLESVFPPGARPFQWKQEPVGRMNDVGRAADPGAAHRVRAALVAVTARTVSRAISRDISRHDLADPVAFHRNPNGASGRAKSAVP